MPVENTTSNRSYQLVDPSNQLEFDVDRIIAALSSIDADIALLFAGLSAKANASHTHEIANVTGLQEALDSKLSSVGNIEISNVNSLQTALDAKANLSGATFTGGVSGVTPSTGANNTLFATTAWVRLQGYLTAVVTANIGDGQVTLAKLAANSVDTTKLTDGAATEPKIGTGAVTETKLGAGSVTETKLGNGAATTNKIGDGAVTPAKAAAAMKTSTIGAILDGGGAVIVAGERFFMPVPFACTIKSWNIVGDASGSIVVDVKRATYANFPTTTSIAASAKPTLSSAQKNTNSTLTGWTTALAAGDWIEFVAEATPATVKRVTVNLVVERT